MPRRRQPRDRYGRFIARGASKKEAARKKPLRDTRGHFVETSLEGVGQIFADILGPSWTVIGSKSASEADYRGYVKQVVTIEDGRRADLQGIGYEEAAKAFERLAKHPRALEVLSHFRRVHLVAFLRREEDGEDGYKTIDWNDGAFAVKSAPFQIESWAQSYPGVIVAFEFIELIPEGTPEQRVAKLKRRIGEREVLDANEKKELRRLERELKRKHNQGVRVRKARRRRR